MTKLRIPAVVAAFTVAGYAGSALAQQAPATDPTAQTTQSAPASSTTSPSYGTDPAAAPPSSSADSAAASGSPSSATAPDSSTGAAPSADAKPAKKDKKHHKPAGAETDPAAAPSSDTPKP